jgi:predicted ATPase
LAHQTVDKFSGGVWFVDLATLSEPALVPQVVAAVLGVREEPGRPLLETLIGALRSRSALLVLDNCEHLVEACARLCETLLGTCPELRVLATSRERLGVGNEVMREVSPLSVPERDRPLDQRAIHEYPAVRLFVERARAAGQSLVLSPSTAQVIGQICARLDRLDTSLRLLSGGSRTARRAIRHSRRRSTGAMRC